jgi:hypothetical protein
MINFESRIYKEGFNYVAEVPREVGVAFKSTGYVPIRGLVDGKKYLGTMIPRKNNRYVLFLNADIRQRTHKGKDDKVNIEIEFDPESRELLLPEDIELIFSEDNEVFSNFRNMTLSHRREIIKYISQAKGAESRLYRIQKMIDHIRERVYIK